MPIMLLAGEGRPHQHFRLCAAQRLHPAKVWGLYPRKGSLTPGSDADIAIVDLDHE